MIVSASLCLCVCRLAGKHTSDAKRRQARAQSPDGGVGAANLHNQAPSRALICLLIVFVLALSQLTFSFGQPKLHPQAFDKLARRKQTRP